LRMVYMFPPQLLL